MKNISILLLLSLFWVTTAHANPSWQDAFLATFQESGAPNAVTEALEKGISPNDILKYILTIEGSPEETLKAMYCAGADARHIEFSATNNNIPEEVIIAAFEKSVEECSDQIQAPEAYAPGMSGNMFGGRPSPGNPPIGGGGGGPPPSPPGNPPTDVGGGPPPSVSPHRP